MCTTKVIEINNKGVGFQMKWTLGDVVVVEISMKETIVHNNNVQT